MTRKECIKWLKSLKTEIGKSGHQELWHYAEAIDKVIEALSADAVSREDYHNLLTASEDIDRALREYQAKEEQLSAEMVPVVRCKDCRYYECGGLPCPLDVCESLGDDGFCSCGERRAE